MDVLQGLRPRRRPIRDHAGARVL